MSTRVIEFQFKGDPRDLQKALDTVQGESAETAKSVKSGGAAMAAAFAGAAVAVAAAGKILREFGKLAQKALKETIKETLELSEQANVLAKSAKKIGESVEDIQRVEGAFGLLTARGVDGARMIQDFRRSLAEARDGTVAQADALDKLGLSIEDFEGLSLAEQMALVGDSFVNLRDNADQTQVAMDLFGRSGREAIAAFTQGGDEFRAAVDQVERAGLISSETAAQAEVLQDSIDLMGASLDTLRREFVAPLIPAFTGIVDGITLIAQRSQLLASAGSAGVAFAEGINASVTAIATFGGLTESAIRHALDWANALRAPQKALEGLSRAMVGDFVGAQRAFSAASMIGQASLSSLLSTSAMFDQTMDEWGSWAHTVEQSIERARQAGQKFEAPDLGTGGGGGGDDPGAGGGSPGTTTTADVEGTKARLAELLDAQREAAEEHLTLKLETTEAIDEAEREKHAAALRRTEELKQARLLAAQQWLTATSAVVGSLGGLFTQLSQTAIQASEEEGAARLKEARDWWYASQAMAIMQAGVNVPLAISNALTSGSQINPIFGAVMAVAAGVTAGIALGGVIAQTAAGPPFHSGGAITTAAAAGLQPDEVSITGRLGEWMLNNQGVRALGEDTIRAANAGVEGGGMQSATFVTKVDHRVYDVQTSRAIKRTGSPLNMLARSTNPRGTARRNPYQPRV